MPIVRQHAQRLGVAPLLWLLLGLLNLSGAWAGGFEVISASTKLDSGLYRLSARIEYHFSKPALDAMQNGVPLTVEIEMAVRRRRSWAWDETVYSLSQRFRLEYHTLSRQYLVNNLNSGERRGFPTGNAALQFIGQIHDFPFLDKGLLSPNERYEGALRAWLDIESLPVPLRVLAYLSDDWRLTSDWYTWPL
ncbi:conserved exported hypothetical protein [Candidatus Competibacter denitrificans Run_A_D11]|uniref:Proline rich signal peptide protein n=1 Tax=Candidatus Competibacter denitrificans Run_A_D11 TaxID=1400863 RepID=W6M549_9GAMM|nr:DUF4390 domain-containing protein [Candidatus Competibacter denitrificans]CDI00930.1 conserved exported hypothetical protein [Candidatus Competibacter denitrificans Run_A_D11]HAS85848.1 DUF4390 domain-containing protein [Candidatus Competibacteraceae bacterium]HRC70045.1 DUF4390 domain-containing protein [Candidatus Competibacter denitrificans]